MQTESAIVRKKEVTNKHVRRLAVESEAPLFEDYDIGSYLDKGTAIHVPECLEKDRSTYYAK